MKTDASTPQLLIASCYAACALLVIIFVNLFSLYRLVEEQFGSGLIKWAPLLLPPVLLLIFLVKTLFPSDNKEKKLKKNWIWAGVVLSIFALFLPDPQIAVKKIHVTEYLLLSLLARYTMSFQYSGRELLLFSALFTALLGVHDEFLQGLHPFRTYGLRDMAVNVSSALGGGFIWHGLQLFSKDGVSHTAKPSPAIVTYLILLILSVPALAVPISSYLQSRLPLWPILPLGATLFFWVMYYPTIQKSQYHHGVSALSYTSMLFLFYPVIGYVFQTAFY